ncbi:hypothetical protein HY636_05490 [Candidatus Woesearchaeota archaeon]|nr:hypothetical protein [Candidatus Woesearchaeota archaeon]
MHGTLNERIEKLVRFKRNSKELGISFDDNLLEVTRNTILADFFAQNKLAYRVAKRETSYTEQIQPILEKYNTFWKRIETPEVDESFDTLVNQVLGSMNAVGIAYVTSHTFTTVGRRARERRANRTYLIEGGILAVALWALIKGNFDMHLDIPAAYESFTKAIPILGLIAPYVALKPLESPRLKVELNYLRFAAEKTDEFLRENYAERK